MIREAIKKVIQRFYPEIDAGLHLPICAVVTSIPDAPEKSSNSDPYRPRLAVNIKLLDRHLREEEKQPELKGVPISIPAAGMERGLTGFPKPGTIVEIAFMYGDLSKPFVRSIMPYRLTLPETDADSLKLQQNINSFQKVDRSGNWERQTNGKITDDSKTHVTNTINKLQTIVNEITRVKAHSKENVSGLKRIKAGAIKFLTIGTANIAAAFNLNLTSAKNINIVAAVDSFFRTGRNRKIETTGNHTEIIGAGRTETIQGNHSESISADKSSTVGGTSSQIAQKVWIGTSIDSIPHLTSEFMLTVIQALEIIETHTHPSVSKPNQEDDIKNKRIEVTTQKARMDIIKS